MRDEYNKMTVLRPRPTTPVTKPTLDRLASFEEYARNVALCSRSNSVCNDINDAKFNTNVPIKNRLPPDAGAKIHVTIPTNVIQQCKNFTYKKKCLSYLYLLLNLINNDFCFY